jgi:hypothetical protein
MRKGGCDTVLVGLHEGLRLDGGIETLDGVDKGCCEMVLVGADEGLVVGPLDGNEVGSVGAGVACVAVGGFNGAPVARTSETAKAYTVP